MELEKEDATVSDDMDSLCDDWALQRRTVRLNTRTVLQVCFVDTTGGTVPDTMCSVSWSGAGLNYILRKQGSPQQKYPNVYCSATELPLCVVRGCAAVVVLCKQASEC